MSFKGKSWESYGATKAMAEQFKVERKAIYRAGGAEKLSKLSPEVQRILLGKSK